MSAMRRMDAAAWLFLALGAACLLARLGAVPALSLDEAWIGLFADRLRGAGAYTPHQMNHYTGPLYAWAASWVMQTRGISVESLRLLGALLNTLALLGGWVHLRRRFGAEAGLAWAVLCAASPYLLLKSRLAWEVYALQPLLVVACLPLLSGGPARTAALAALTVLGTQNHFIFLALPASLVLMFAARSAWRGEKGLEPALRASLCALAAGLAFALVKNPISDESWMAHRAAWTTALLGGPLIAGLVGYHLPLRPLPKFLKPLVGLLLIAGLVWHAPALVEVLGGGVVYMRMFSLDLPWASDAALLGWGLLLAGLVAWRAVGAWHRVEMTPHERTLALWPAFFLPAFVLFRHTSSLRYYSLPMELILLALAAAAPRLPRADKKPLLLVALSAALVTQAFLWREFAAPADRKPLTFRVGWRRENSKDFARKDALFAAFDAAGACRIEHKERSFTAIPLSFHALARGPRPCDAGLGFDAGQCPDCPQAPYFRWELVRVP